MKNKEKKIDIKKIKMMKRISREEAQLYGKSGFHKGEKKRNRSEQRRIAIEESDDE